MFASRLAAVRSCARVLRGGRLRKPQIGGSSTSLAPSSPAGAPRSHGTWSYREPPPDPPARDVYIARAIGGLMWWWIFWHICTQPGHIVGEWPIIEPSKWTDEELGIPPDEEGPAPRLQ